MISCIFHGLGGLQWNHPTAPEGTWKDSQHGNRHSALKSKLDLAKLWTNMSKIRLEEADGFYDGKVDPGVDF